MRVASSIHKGLRASVVIVTIGGCRPTGTPPVPEPLADPCSIGSWSTPLDTVTIALALAISPSDVARPETMSATMAHRHVYEGLVRVDCNGDVRAALASAWESSEDGMRWQFTLAQGIHSATGEEITSRQVARAWGVRPATTRTPQSLDDPPAVVDSIDAADRYGFTVFLNRPVFAVAAFAAREWSVVTGETGGTGAYRFGTSGPTGTTLLGPNRILLFRSFPAGDARNAIDAGAQIIVTDDPSAIDYAGVRNGYETHPLPWNREYLLVLEPSAGAAAPLTGLLDAVAVDARMTPLPHWSGGVAACRVHVPPGGVVPRQSAVRLTNKIVYDADDSTGRRLAERIVALGAPSPGVQLTGLSQRAYADALRLGGAPGYIVALDTRARTPCQRWQELVERARWIAHRQTIAVEPLLETRAHLLLAPGIEVSVNGDGTVFVPPRTGTRR